MEYFPRTTEDIGKAVKPKPVDQKKSLDFYFTNADHFLLQAGVYRAEDNHEELYRVLLSYVSFVIETAAKHAQWKKTKKDKCQKYEAQAVVCMEEMEALKPVINEAAKSFIASLPTPPSVRPAQLPTSGVSGKPTSAQPVARPPPLPSPSAAPAGAPRPQASAPAHAEPQPPGPDAAFPEISLAPPAPPTPKGSGTEPDAPFINPGEPFDLLSASPAQLTQVANTAAGLSAGMDGMSLAPTSAGVPGPGAPPPAPTTTTYIPRASANGLAKHSMLGMSLPPATAPHAASARPPPPPSAPPLVKDEIASYPTVLDDWPAAVPDVKATHPQAPPPKQPQQLPPPLGPPPPPPGPPPPHKPAEASAPPPPTPAPPTAPHLQHQQLPPPAVPPSPVAAAARVVHAAPQQPPPPPGPPPAAAVNGHRIYHQATPTPPPLRPHVHAQPPPPTGPPPQRYHYPPQPPPPPPPPPPPVGEAADHSLVPSAATREHVPKRFMDVPKADHANMDHMKLDTRLRLYGLKEKTVRGDGNCQFRALADQLWRDQERHAETRRAVVQQLRREPDHYSPYVGEDYDKYVEDMARETTWGDHITLQAAADAYGVAMCIISSYKDNFVIEIQPKEKRSERVLWISFWAEVHYNSIYPINARI